MKNQVILTIAVLAVFVACTTRKVESPTICCGILPDLKNETIFLVPVDDYFPGLTVMGTYPTTRTDSLGKYKIKFTTTHSNFYQILSHNYHQLNRDIYLEPGDSLFIEQSAWNEQPRFLISGKGSDKLKHLEKDYSIFPGTRTFYDKIRSNYFASELDFKRFIDSIYFKRVDALASSKKIPDVLRKYHLNTLKAERAQLLLEHLERRNYYMKQEFGYFYPHKSYYQFLDSTDLDNDFAKTIAAKNLTNDYLSFQNRLALKSNKDEKENYENIHWKFVFVSDQPQSLWTDLLALSTINDFSFGMMEDHFFDDLEAFDHRMNNKFSKSENQQLFEANIIPYTNLTPGKPAPDFSLPDSKGILHRLSDYKGTIIYLDFWGTWCYPCIEEIPDALVLQEKYKGKPVTFLYVAMEYDSTNIAGWKNFILGKDPNFAKFLNNKPFPGIHLVAEKQFRNETISAYQLNFAPTHVLIDKNGMIVKARASRSKEIQKDIDALLTKF